MVDRGTSSPRSGPNHAPVIFLTCAARLPLHKLDCARLFASSRMGYIHPHILRGLLESGPYPLKVGVLLSRRYITEHIVDCFYTIEIRTIPIWLVGQNPTSLKVFPSIRDEESRLPKHVADNGTTYCDVGHPPQADRLTDSARALLWRPVTYSSRWCHSSIRSEDTYS